MSTETVRIQIDLTMDQYVTLLNNKRKEASMKGWSIPDEIWEEFIDNFKKSPFFNRSIDRLVGELRHSLEPREDPSELAFLFNNDQPIEDSSVDIATLAEKILNWQGGGSVQRSNTQHQEDINRSAKEGQ